MSLLPTPGAWIDAISGVLLVALAVFVARVRVRAPANLAFAVFAGCFGLAFLAGNLVSLDDPLRVALGNANDLLLAPAGVAVIALALTLPRPLAARELTGAILVGMVVASAVAVSSWRAGGVLLDPGRPFAAASLGFRYAMWAALALLALRCAWLRGPSERTARRQVALVSAALLMFPGLNAGLLASNQVIGLLRFPVGFGKRNPGLPEELVAPLWVATAMIPIGIAFLWLIAALWLRNARRTQGGESRAARNVAWLALALPLLGLLLAIALGGEDAARDAGPLGVARTLSVLLLAYAILRHQLLGIDVQARWTVRQSTVAAMFLAVYFVVSEGAQQVLSGPLGPYLGIVAAGVLLFLLTHLQRLAGRFSERAIPPLGAGLPAEERAAIYQEQVRIAWQDGSLTRKERALLDKLRESIGLSHEEASRLEGEALRGEGEAGVAAP